MSSDPREAVLAILAYGRCLSSASIRDGCLSRIGVNQALRELVEEEKVVIVYQEDIAHYRLPEAATDGEHGRHRSRDLKRRQ